MRADNWALITISGTEITGIEAVTLDRATLDSGNFIPEVNADLLAEALRGEHSATTRAAWRFCGNDSP